MKRKILAVGLLSLCTLAMFIGESQAFHGLWHRHNRYVTQITCRPYNAFTPICWGNLVCDGCCPSPCGVAGGCMPINMGVPPFASFCGMPYMGGGFAPSMAYASDMHMSAPQQGPMMPMPDVRSQPFMPPAPMPLPQGPNTTMMYPQSGVAQANYYPMYMPQYYPPTFYNPYQNMQPMPYYWYNGGR